MNTSFSFIYEDIQ